MVVSDIDLRLLRVFFAVVKAGGYSNAQTLLGVSQSTISTHMSQLETRVGFCLCNRGRSGFKLTCEGESLYTLVVNLFHSMEDFQTNTADIKKGISGNLHIGFLDNIINDSRNPLQQALSEFVRYPDNSVEISLECLSPPKLEKGLLDHSLDIAIGIFNDRMPGLIYQPLYFENEVLVCHKDHEFAEIEDIKVLTKALPASRRVLREFIGYREFPFETDADVTATVSTLEASTFLILTGEYIGFLPVNYVEPRLNNGELVALIPEQYNRQSEFYLVTRDTVQSQSRALSFFIKCIMQT